MVDLSICVLHYNRWDLTKECLDSIETQRIPCAVEKMVLDNGSLIPWPEKWAEDRGWRIRRYAENRGHIVGQNRCFESAQGAWVLFVANDIRLQGACLETLWRARRAWRIVQPTLWTTTGTIDNRGLVWTWPGYGISQRRWGSTTRLTSPSGSCYFMRRDLWEQVGKFDERLRTSHEDIDFGLRATAFDCTSTCVPGAHALHLGNATLGTHPSHSRAAFHHDRLAVIQKHYSGLNRLSRQIAVNLLDGSRALWYNCNRADTHSTPGNTDNSRTEPSAPDNSYT